MDDERPLVALSDYWRARAIEVGKGRRDYALAHNYGYYWGPGFDIETDHIVGAMAEAAVAAHLKLPWRPCIGNIWEVDVGNLVEVRGRRVPGSGTDLAIRPKDYDDKPYTHTHVYPDYNVRLIGWLYGREAKQAGSWNAKCSLWYCPPPYRSIRSLVDWVATQRAMA